MILNDLEKNYVETEADNLHSKIMPIVKENIDQLIKYNLSKIGDIFPFFLRRLMMKIGIQIYMGHFSEGVAKECDDYLDKNHKEMIKKSLNKAFDAAILNVKNKLEEDIEALRIETIINAKIKKRFTEECSLTKEENLNVVAIKLHDAFKKKKIGKKLPKLTDKKATEEGATEGRKEDADIKDIE